MAGLGLVIVADVLLIPSHGLVGAAWASAFAYSMMGLITFLRLRRHRLETGG
jgi:Na+-driven multidrug efflux pump